MPMLDTQLQAARAARGPAVKRPHVVYLRLTPAEFAVLERAAAVRARRSGLHLTPGQLARTLVVRGALKEVRHG